MRLNYLAGKKSGKYSNELPYELYFLSLLIYSCTTVSYPSVPSNTLLLIPNEFETVFELGVQRLETLEQLEIQYICRHS